MSGGRTTAEPRGIEAVTRFLARRDVSNEVVEHDATYSAFATTPLPEVGDLRLLRHDRIVRDGGEHRRSVRMGALELLRITEPRVADICEHPEARELADRRQPFKSADHNDRALLDGAS
jgi:hypothetical protein